MISVTGWPGWKALHQELHRASSPEAEAAAAGAMAMGAIRVRSANADAGATSCGIGCIVDGCAHSGPASEKTASASPPAIAPPNPYCAERIIMLISLCEQLRKVCIRFLRKAIMVLGSSGAVQIQWKG
jgi:hypothetical protein